LNVRLQPDWQRTLGQRVEIWRDGELVRKGTVDAVMPDDSMLWVSVDGAMLREIFTRADGYQVFTHFPLTPATY
jgi:hypothetical protein